MNSLHSSWSHKAPLSPLKRYCQTLTLVDDFDFERDMARLATLPRQGEWEAYVARFQGCAADARSDDKWQRMEMIF